MPLVMAKDVCQAALEQQGLGMEYHFSANKRNQGHDPDPQQQGDCERQRAIHQVVVPELLHQIDQEHRTGDQDQQRGDAGSGQDSLSTRLLMGHQSVDQPEAPEQQQATDQPYAELEHNLVGWHHLEELPEQVEQETRDQGDEEDRADAEQHDQLDHEPLEEAVAPRDAIGDIQGFDQGPEDQGSGPEQDYAGEETHCSTCGDHAMDKALDGGAIRGKEVTEQLGGLIDGPVGIDEVAGEGRDQQQ